MQCDCEGHDRAFARWTGFWPGDLESKELGIDLNDFYLLGYDKLIFIKPIDSALLAAIDAVLHGKGSTLLHEG